MRHRKLIFCLSVLSACTAIEIAHANGGACSISPKAVKSLEEGILQLSKGTPLNGTAQLGRNTTLGGNSPSVEATHARLYPNSPDPAAGINALQNEAAALRTKIEHGELQGIEAEATWKRIDDLYTSMRANAKQGYQIEKIDELEKEALTAYYFGKFPGRTVEEKLSRLPAEDLQKVIQDIEGRRAAVDGSRPGAADHKIALWHVSNSAGKELRKRPEVLAQNQANMRAAGEQFKASQKTAEVDFRRTQGGLGAALSNEHRQEVDSLIDRLSSNPTSLTAEEGKKVQAWLSDFDKRDQWKSGSYAGVHPEEEQRAQRLRQALQNAREKIQSHVNSHQGSLADGRRPSQPTAPIHSRDPYSGQGRTQHLITTHHAAQRQAKSQPWQDEIAAEIGMHSGSAARPHIQYRALFKKTDSPKWQKVLESKGFRLSEGDLDNLNIASTIDAMHAKDAGINYEQLQKIVRELDEAKIQAKFADPADHATLRKLKKIAEYHLTHRVDVKLDF